MKKTLSATKKAVQSLAETTTMLSKFLVRFVEGPGEQFLGGLDEWSRFYRYKNLLKILDKVNDIHQKRKLQGKPIPIPPKFALPIMQAASLENEEPLQDLWARLIANATDPTASMTFHPNLAEVLRNISSDEALIIRELANSNSFPSIATKRFGHNSINDLRFPRDSEKELKKEFENRIKNIPIRHSLNLDFYWSNLRAIGLLEISTSIGAQRVKFRNPIGSKVPEEHETRINISYKLYFTDIANRLVEACDIRKDSESNS